MAWWAERDSNPRASSCKEAALARLSYPPIFGRTPEIRTPTGRGLNALPLPIGVVPCIYGSRPEIRTRTEHALNVLPLPVGVGRCGRPSRIRTETFTGSEPVPSANWGKGPWYPRSESNTRRTVRSRVLCPLSYEGLVMAPTEGIEPPPRDS